MESIPAGRFDGKRNEDVHAFITSIGASFASKIDYYNTVEKQEQAKFAILKRESGRLDIKAIQGDYIIMERVDQSPKKTDMKMRMGMTRGDGTLFMPAFRLQPHCSTLQRPRIL